MTPIPNWNFLKRDNKYYFKYNKDLELEATIEIIDYFVETHNYIHTDTEENLRKIRFILELQN